MASFAKIYPDGIQRSSVKNAIATFERSLVTPNSRFDRYLRGDQGAIDDEEKEGYRLFKVYGCASCHQGAGVGGNMYATFGVLSDYFADRERVTRTDLGRFNVTRKEEDRHRFKVPGLRNVALHRTLLPQRLGLHPRSGRECDGQVSTRPADPGGRHQPHRAVPANAHRRIPGEAAEMKTYAKPLLFGSVLVVILSLLYWNTRAEGRNHYLEMVGRLRYIRQTDAVLNQDILKSSSGALGNYDSLNLGLASLRESGEVSTPSRRLTTAAPRSNYRPTWTSSSPPSTRRSGSSRSSPRETRSSRIRSTTCRSPPRALAKPPTRPAACSLGETANAFLGEILLYTLTGHPGQVARLEVQIDALRKTAAGLTASRGARLTLLANHGRVIIRQKPQVDSLVARLLAVPIPQCSNDLHEIYQRANERELDRAAIVQTGLYLFSVVLVSVMVNAMRRLASAPRRSSWPTRTSSDA